MLNQLQSDSLLTCASEKLFRVGNGSRFRQETIFWLRVDEILGWRWMTI
ncbi:MAG: hypothetical protein AAGA18_08540 [Verrucomicrobiota bacterium]